MDLEAFGQILRAYRKKIGLTQSELAQQLSVSTNLISIWERGYQHRGRTWVPERQSAKRLVEILADYLDPTEAQSWLALLGYELGRNELAEIFPDFIPADNSPQTLEAAEPHANFRRLEVVTEQQMVGVTAEIQQLTMAIRQQESPWIIAIDGIGGIGKTALASAVLGRVMVAAHYHDVIWVSARQQDFLPGIGLRTIKRSELNLDGFTSAALKQMDANILLSVSPREKNTILRNRLKEKRYLVVIDNLETVVEYQTLIPMIRELANPSKFLLTSRYSLHNHSDVFCHTMKELSLGDTIQFLDYEIKSRGKESFWQASEENLQDIYEVVGGNPLALKLVVGQSLVLTLSQVLENLAQAQSQNIDELYTHIYWQAWHALNEPGQQTLLAMPLARGSDFDHLSALSETDDIDLQQALEQLVTMSLLIVHGSLDNRRYDIHQLTETFLLNEVVKWQANM